MSAFKTLVNKIIIVKIDCPSFDIIELFETQTNSKGNNASERDALIHGQDLIKTLMHLTPVDSIVERTHSVTYPRYTVSLTWTELSDT